MLPAMALCIGKADALGLGELSVRSRLGARFHAEVQLIESAGDARSSEACFRLGGPGGTESEIPALTRGRISIERKNGRSTLVILSDQTINEPVLQVNVRVGCGSEFVRSYTALIDPAVAQPAEKQTGTSPPPEAREVTRPEASSPKVWQTTEGESARSIARALFPHQPGAQRRFLTGLRRENPELDLGETGELPLDAGVMLNLPDIRRRVASAAPVGAGAKPVAKEAKARTSPMPARPEQHAAQNPGGRMADHLVISGDGEPDASGSELPLRLSTDLSEHLSGKVSESARTMLRLEYRLLNSLYVQAAQQLEVAEQVRNLEAGLEEMRLASEKAARDTDAAMSAAAAAKPAVPSAAPDRIEDKKLARPVREDNSGWWLEILIILGLIGALTWVLVSRSGKRKPASLPVAGDIPPDVPPAAEKSGEHEARRPPPIKPPAIVSDIVLDDEPAKDHAMIEYVANDIQHRDAESKAGGDYATVMELAEIMVCFGRIKGATQALEEFLEHSPETALEPWLKLLEIYRLNEMREEFATYSIKLGKHFNVAPATWEAAGECLKQLIPPVDGNDMSIEELLKILPTIDALPHVRENIRDTWDSREGLAYLKNVLRDTRDNKRGGFPLAIARELTFLADILEARFQHRV